MTQPARPTHWWHAVDRRTFNKGALAFTALLSMSGCKSEKEQAADSLKLQQEQGWNVGPKRVAYSLRVLLKRTRLARRTGASIRTPRA